MSLQGKTIFITGATRGIGKAIALRAARDGANVVIAAKTVTPHAKLPGTIFTAAEEVEAAGGQALAVATDIRFEEQLQAAVAQTLERFGGIDVLVNNASAISLTGTMATDMKRYDLMHSINSRGTFLASKCCLPALRKADNPHILTLSPPLNLEPHWFGPHVAYSMAKYGMSLCVLGMAEEFRKAGVAVNALWPKTVIGTDALRAVGGMDLKHTRKPEIMADAAHAILTQSSKALSGQFLLDEAVLREAGVTDFDVYAHDPDANIYPDLFV